MFAFSLGFFEKARQQQQQPNTYFFFQKEATDSWFGNKWEVVFSFCFLIYQKKRVLRDKLFLFVEQKHCEVWTKLFEEVEILFCFSLLFLLQATKKLFLFCLQPVRQQKRRSAFLATSMNQPREKSFHRIFVKLLKLFFKLFLLSFEMKLFKHGQFKLFLLK